MSPETIYVAPLSLVETTVADANVSHLVTLINGETLISTPPSIVPDRHLRLAMNDICEPQPGLVLPCETHVADLIRFARDWDRQAPLLIHCWAGISRSTAAAFISLCALNPEGSELELAHALRRASPTAYPNRLLGRARRRDPDARRAHDQCGRGDRARQDRRGGRGVRAAGAACRLDAAMAEPRRKAAVAQETRNDDPQIELGLNAAIVTVREGQPYILVARPGTAGSDAWDALPFGPFAPRAHRTLEIGLREWVKRQTGLDLGYVEQLYTFGDRGRHAEPGGAHTLSVGYLALTRGAGDELLGSHWSPWYAYFPWEDWRKGKPRHPFQPRSSRGSKNGPNGRRSPTSRCARCDGPSASGLRSASAGDGTRRRCSIATSFCMKPVSWRRPRATAVPPPRNGPTCPSSGGPWPSTIAASSPRRSGRLRGKLKYRPVVFELLPPEFTLYELQKTVEAISGTLLHKQNFRRLVEQGGLVEATGNVSTETGGRPARLYRFRREVVLERPAPGLRVKAGRG